MSAHRPRSRVDGGRPPVLRLAVLGIVAMLPLSACAPVLDAGWRPPSWPDTALSTVTEPLPPLDAASLGDGVLSERVRSDAVGIQARFTWLPGSALTGFNDAITAAVWDAVRSAESATGVGYTPQASASGAGLGDRACLTGSTSLPVADLLANPALAGPAVGFESTSLVCDLVWAQGAFVGERLRTVGVAADGAVTDAAHILYGNTAGEVASAGELWIPDAAMDLSQEILETLRRSAGSLSLAPLDDPGALEQITAALHTTTPSPSGGMEFTVAAGFTSPQLAALGIPATQTPMTVRVPADRARPLLTGFGAGLMDSNGQAYAGPGPDTPGTRRVDCGLTPCVALTYDDGPSSLTPRLLDTLSAEGVPATFYMIGQYAAGNPDTVRRVAAEGHEIGNHSWNHPSLPTLPPADVRSQISRTNAVLRELSGQPVATFRPPYGDYNAEVLAAAGMPAILWSVDTRDWAGPEDAVLLDRAIGGASPGAIILFHDTHERSVRLAGDVIAGLRDRGFSFATITELWGGDLPAASAWRSAR